MGRDGTTERRAHSDGVSVEWGLRDKVDITHTYCSSMVFVEWVELAAPSWVCSSVTLWVDAFVVQLRN